MKADLNSPKNIETQFLRIQGNCLEFKNTAIQLSNISLFSTTDVVPERFPIISLLLILAGALLLKALAIPALLMIAAGGFWIYIWYNRVQEAKNAKRLTIITNSGHVFPIVFSDQNFLTQVVSLMTDIIRNPEHTRNVTVNIKDCTFSDESSAIGTVTE